jgi:integrase
MPTHPDQAASEAGASQAQRREQILTAAQRRVALHPPNPQLTDKSRRQYLGVYAALLRDAARSGEPLHVVLETRSSRATVKFARHCTRYCETRALADLLLRLDAFDNNDLNGTATLFDQMQISLERIDQADKAKPPVAMRRRNRATRLQLHPADWQKLLIASAPGKLRIALLILQLTGCRPCEIERGMHFQIGQDGADVRLTLDIVGAKCDGDRGQPLRTFEFLSEDQRPMLSELIAKLMRCMDQVSSPVFRVGDVTKRVSQLARKLWPSHQAHPTAYSFRYAFREHMAMLGATRQQIARAMGHQSMESALCYGRQVARERTLEFTMDISASIEPRPRSRSLEYARSASEQRGYCNIMAQDIGQPAGPALPV